MSGALDILAGLVLEDGRRWGEVAAAGQWADARAVLDLDSPTPRHWVSRARGYSKTLDAAGWCLSAMIAQLTPGSRVYALASDRDQGRLLLDSLRGFAARTPGLVGLLEFGAYRCAVPSTDVVLEVLAADAPGAWGLRPSFVIVDELAQWAPTPGAKTLYEAVVTALPKVKNSRLAIITTSGDPAGWAHGVYSQALADPLWRVSELRGPPPWMSAELLEGERRRLPDATYRRLFLNEWVAGEDRLVVPADLAACVTLDGPVAPQPGQRYVVGLDVGLVRDATVAVVAHVEPAEVYWHGTDRQEEGRRVVVDRLEVWQGSRLSPVNLESVEAWLLQASQSYNGAELILDPWQSVGLGQRLRSKGVTVTEWTFNPASNARLAATLVQLFRNRALALPDDVALLEELANVRLREISPNVYRLDHDSAHHDDRAVALALAATTLLATPASRPMLVGHYTIGRHGQSTTTWAGGSERKAIECLAASGHRLAIQHLDREHERQRNRFGGRTR